MLCLVFRLQGVYLFTYLLLLYTIFVYILAQKNHSEMSRIDMLPRFGGGGCRLASLSLVRQRKARIRAFHMSLKNHDLLTQEH